jgi:prephenate dehydrogenase
LNAELPVESWAQISVVGLGLIGGSMARALREWLPQLRLIGVDRDQVLPAAEAAALADEYVSERDTASVIEAFAASELVFLAAPVSGIRRWLAEALAHGALVTDCGSTKRDILQAAPPRWAPYFVPGHPMAGAGARASEPRADLFRGRPWVVCPEGVDAAALSKVEHLVRGVGARPVRMSAVAHDRAVAWTSHAPRLVASALVALAQREQAFDAAGPALERLMRGAGGSAAMWGDVLASNADEVARALRLLGLELERCAAELETGGGVQLSLEVLAAADGARSAFEAAHGATPDNDTGPTG